VAKILALLDLFLNYTAGIAMTKVSSKEHPNGQTVRAHSVFEPPSYSISHGPDKALQWDPPADSDELAIALSYHFPIQKTLKRKMQAAVEKFLRESGRKQVKCRRLIRGKNRKSPKGTGSPRITIPGLLSFNAETLEEVKVKRRRRAYEQAERVEVGSNRGMACEAHRRQKVKVCMHLTSRIFTIAHSPKCDPTKCLRNGQFRQNRDGPRFLEHSTPTPNDTGRSHQGSIIESNSPLELKAVAEPLNTFLSSTNSFAGDIALASSDSTRQLASKETVSVPEQMSQFMGFQAEFSVPGDPFGFSLDPPFFLGHINDIDNHHPWKSDEFLLSIMRDSMCV
jgi:hypothetical protein